MTDCPTVSTAAPLAVALAALAVLSIVGSVRGNDAVAVVHKGMPPSRCDIRGNLFYQGHHTATRHLIELVNGDQPKAWTWSDNIAWGALGMEAPAGVNLANPNLVADPSGLWLPTTATPTASLLNERPNCLDIDLLGTATAGPDRTVGAVQYVTKFPPRSPLTATRVGPDAE
jgi:hypothetical protein